MLQRKTFGKQNRPEIWSDYHHMKLLKQSEVAFSACSPLPDETFYNFRAFTFVNRRFQTTKIRQLTKFDSQVFRAQMAMM